VRPGDQQASPGDGVTVQPDTIGKRLEAIAGPEALPPGQAFDPSRPPHVDRAARLLLERFHRDNDGVAFALLVEIAQPLLEGAAYQITRDQGLAQNPRELVSAYLGQVYVDLRRPPHIPESFVDHALAAMDADARERVQALAHRVAEPAAGTTAAGRTPPVAERLAGRFAAIVSACFHALDEADRRILIALDVDRLSYAEIAERFGIYQDQVAQRIIETRGRLAARIAAVFSSIEPPRRDLP
jgi:DNA-directed RNA polymerase specialized sigma24 family protein